MPITFTPSPDVAVLLNVLLDRLENRAPLSPTAGDEAQPGAVVSGRAINLQLEALALPGYFSQTDPEPRLIANRQLQTLAQHDLLHLIWLPGESGHLLHAVSLKPGAMDPGALYALLGRRPLADGRARLESLLLSDRFRFPSGDWRAKALSTILAQLRAGKSPAPFSFSDSGWNQDLLSALIALDDLAGETPYRVFSVRVFNDSKRFEALKPALLRLARQTNPLWRSLAADDLLRELNLVANPGYIHFAGAWELTTHAGEILSLGGFSPSVGFPAAQAAALLVAAIHAPAVLCIENLTSFHSAARQNRGEFALLCIMGNPSPAVRTILRLLPHDTPIYLWSDLDYGGFNILSQMRMQVSPRVQSYRMDVATFEAYAALARPLTHSDSRYLRSLLVRPSLADVRPIIQHLLNRGLKLEQEALE